MAKPKLSRRTMLRAAGVAGLALALPPLEAMTGSKDARAATPKRLVIYQYPNGLFLPDWLPSGVGASWTPSLLMQRQPDDPAVIDTDLATLRPDINIVSGLTNAHMRTDAHTGPNNSFLTGSVDPQTWTATGPSIDEVVAGAIGADTYFSALRLSIYRNIAYQDMSTTICFDQNGQPIQPMTSPQTLYGMLTGLVSPAGEPSVNHPQIFRRGILDYLAEDIERLRGRCGIGDKRVLDQHLESVRELEHRLALLESVSCELPDLSAELDDLPDPPPPSPTSPPLWPDTANAANLPLRSDIMQRLAVLALRCDLTRVVVLSMGPSSSRLTYPFLDMGNTDDHYYSHLQQEPSNRDKQLEYNRLTRWKLCEFAHLVDKLKAVDESGASLLDETLVVCGSELANGAGHTADLMPMVVAGNVGPMASAAGRNRHVVVPCDPSSVVFRNPGTAEQTTVAQIAPETCSASGAYTPLANLWLTVLQALGIDASSFGDATGTVSGLWT